MNTRETRQIWLVTKDGAPDHFAWAHVKTWAETDPTADHTARSHNSALGELQLEADGWDATPTSWRRVPRTIHPGWLFAAAAPSVEGRELVVAGIRYNLDRGGRFRAPGQEPHEPDAVVDDEEELLAAVEALGREVRFVEHGTGASWEVRHDGQAAAAADVAIYRGPGGAAAKLRRTA